MQHNIKYSRSKYDARVKAHVKEEATRKSKYPKRKIIERLKTYYYGNKYAGRS